MSVGLKCVLVGVMVSSRGIVVCKLVLEPQSSLRAGGKPRLLQCDVIRPREPSTPDSHPAALPAFRHFTATKGHALTQCNEEFEFSTPVRNALFGVFIPAVQV